MAFDRGLEMAVGVPGDRARGESRDVTNVSVVKGRLGFGVLPSLGGR